MQTLLSSYNACEIQEPVWQDNLMSVAMAYILWKQPEELLMYLSLLIKMENIFDNVTIEPSSSS